MTTIAQNYVVQNEENERHLELSVENFLKPKERTNRMKLGRH